MSYELKIHEDGETLGCSRCDSEVPLIEAGEEDLCCICFETLVGQNIFYRKELSAKAFAQAMNLLLERLGSNR